MDAYHVAPTQVRASIRTHGLDPRRFAAAADPARYRDYTPVRDDGFFLFDALPIARWYAALVANQEPAEEMDIWLVRPTERLQPDDELVPGGDEAANAGSWFHRGFTRPVRLVATVRPGRGLILRPRAR